MDFYILNNDMPDNRYYELFNYELVSNEVTHTTYSVELIFSTVMWFVLIACMSCLCNKCVDSYLDPRDEYFQEIVDQYKLKLEELDNKLIELQLELDNSNKLLLESKYKYFNCHEAAQKFVDAYLSDSDSYETEHSC